MVMNVMPAVPILAARHYPTNRAARNAVYPLDAFSVHLSRLAVLACGVNGLNGAFVTGDMTTGENVGHFPCVTLVWLERVVVGRVAAREEAKGWYWGYWVDSLDV